MPSGPGMLDLKEDFRARRGLSGGGGSDLTGWEADLQWRTVEDLEGEVGTLAGSLSWPVLRLLCDDRTVAASLSWRLL